MRLILLRSSSHNPYQNLAIEELAFQRLQRDRDFILLYTWINCPTVFIGRNQNPYVECDIEKMSQDHVLLARRKTGGGAVYHDLGNLNYTMVANELYADKAQWNKVICDALAGIGISAFSSGRNDILIGEKKISGTAYLTDGSMYLQHGTMMVNVDLSAVTRYLTPHKSKFQKHGIHSIDQRVCNLSEIDASVSIEKIEQAIRHEFIKTYSAYDYRDMNVEELLRIEEIRRLLKCYSSNNYLYGDFLPSDSSDDGM